MSFPFQSDIRGVLEDQAQTSRSRSTTFGFGRASITAGDGSLDLIDSDDSVTPVASVGDLPDGSQGVGAVIDGRMENLATYSKTLKTEIATERAKNGAQDSTLGSHTARIAALEAALTGVQGDITGINVADLRARITTLESKVRALEQK